MSDTNIRQFILDMGAPGQGAPTVLRWMADWLPDADQRHLTQADLARLDAYRGTAGELHEMLGAIAPPARPIWYETTVTAQGGTDITMGYGAVPMPDGIDIGWVCYEPRSRRLGASLGPARVTTTQISRPAGITDDAWRELRICAGIIIRALLLNLGQRIDGEKDTG